MNSMQIEDDVDVFMVMSERSEDDALSKCF